MLCKWDLSCFLNELVGLHSIVKVKLDLFESLEHACLIIDSLQTKLFLQVLLFIGIALSNLLVAVLRTHLVFVLVVVAIIALFTIRVHHLFGIFFH